MSLHGAYDRENVFARILRGEIPSHEVLEDVDVLAFMDVYPQSPGHVLVVSRTSEARNLLDVDPGELARLMSGVQRVTRAVVSALEPDGVILTQFSGAPAGQTVFHLHFHVIPHYPGAVMGRHAAGAPGDPAELARIAQRIRERL